jgi:hypothetical protein
MKRAIDLVREAIAFLKRDPDRAHAYLKQAIDLLQNPRYLTPEQFREIEGRDYPDYGLVYYIQDEFETWGRMFYWEFKSLNVWGEEVYLPRTVVCAYNLIEPPPDDWRPE